MSNPRGGNLATRVRADAEAATSQAVISRAVRRAESKKSKAATAKRRRQTPSIHQSNHVENERVHDGNETARQTDARSEISRDSEQPTAWNRASQLAAPDPRPGMVQRWVRYRTGNTEDADNLEKMLDQGWRPRPSKSVRGQGHELTASLKGKYGQYIVKRGLILMELPEKLADQRNAFYDEKRNRMTESVDNDMFKLNDRVMPFLRPKRKTHVTKTARRGRLDENVPGDDEQDNDD